MNVSVAWLRELAPDLSLSVEEIVERLALRGAPVEGVEHLDDGLAEVIVARVEEAAKHPNADRLTLCSVNDGTSTLQVVCGAPNVKSGHYYPFAPVGSTLPGGFTLTRRKIRGTYSEGMLCSPSELGLGSDHDGIMELSGTPELGTRLVDVLALDDVRLDVEVTSNRPDLLSHRGIARELVEGGQANLHLAEIPDAVEPAVVYTRGGTEAGADGCTVRIDDPDLCARYLGAVIRGVRVGPSPTWLQNRLRAAGARPINNVVDATNWVLLELGQPLHAFDLSTLAESTIVVRRARSGETLRTLDGTDRTLGSEMLAICDAERPVAVAGVMGGLDTEVTTQTTDVLLECALFHPPSVRNTRQALGMSTDASYRFERGVDPGSMELAIERCVAVILATAGGTAQVPVADAHPRAWSAAQIDLRPSRVERVLGVPFEPDTLTDLLQPLGFEVLDREPDRLNVRVPGYRSYDVKREIDLIEEVARTWGYDRFPAELSGFRPSSVPDDLLFVLMDGIRARLVGQGMFEVQTSPFSRDGDVRLPNPVSVEESFLRRELLESVLRPASYNFARGRRDIRLFETATIFRTGEAGQPPAEEVRLALVLTGARVPQHWSAPATDFDAWDAKALLAEMARQAWPTADVTVGEVVGDADLTSFVTALFHARADDVLVGVAGEVDRVAMDLPAWAAPVFGIELRLPDDPQAVQPAEYTPLSAFPGSDRDVSLLVPAGVTAAQIEAVLRSHAGSLLVDVRLLDLYEGDELPDGQRSLTYRLFFQSFDSTLKDSDVDPSVERVVRVLGRELGVTQRGGSASGQ